MPRGGKRDGAGRPRKNIGRPQGTQELEPRANRKDLPIPTESAIKEFENFKKTFYLKLKPYLSIETKKMYEDLMDGVKDLTPLDCLKNILKDMMVRFGIGRLEELKANRTWEGITKEIDVIRQLVEAINRIEHDSPTLKLNILNILTQDMHKDKVKQITEKMFSINEPIDEANFEIVDELGITSIQESTSINGGTGINEV